MYIEESQTQFTYLFYFICFLGGEGGGGSLESSILLSVKCETKDFFFQKSSPPTPSYSQDQLTVCCLILKHFDEILYFTDKPKISDQSL